MEVTRRQTPPRRAPGARQHQRGDIILITLVALLICLLGLLAAMRSGAVETLMSGNNLVRQKDIQAGDIALRQVESQIQAIYGGAPLETSANTQTWYRDVAAGTAAPSGSYWSSCAGNASASARCGSFTLSAAGTTLPYTAYAVVQPTGRFDASSCSMGTAAQYVAEYYDIFIHVVENSGATAVNTETVFRICTLSS